MTNKKEHKNIGIYVDYEKAEHIRILYPNSESKFQSGEYILKVLKIKSLSKIHEYYDALSEDQHAEFDEIILEGYNIKDKMKKSERLFYETLTRTEKSSEQERKFFAIGEVKKVYLWNFDFWVYNKFKAITFKITDDYHDMIDGLFIYERKHCPENIYSKLQLEEILSSNADTQFKIQFQALPTKKQTKEGQIERPRLLRIYDLSIS